MTTLRDTTMEPILFPKPKLHLFVCINDRTTVPGSKEILKNGISNSTGVFAANSGVSDPGGNEKSSCGPRITADHVKELKQWIREQGLTMEVFCTKVQCLGFCNSESSVAVLYPKGIFVKYQGIGELKELVQREILGKGL